MKKLLLAIVLVSLGASQGAVLSGALRINTDTTGTNTKSSAITVSAQTNLLAGSLTSSNLTANRFLVSGANGLLTSATNTGTGSVVADQAPTITAPVISGHATIEGVTPTGATGSGALVFGTSPTLGTPTIASLVNATHTHQNAAGGGTLDAAAIAAGTVATARLGSGTANTTTFLRGDQSFAQPVENSLNLADNTTNNVSTSKHGFAPKGDNNAAHYLDGTGAYSTPSGSGANWVASGSTNSTLPGIASADQVVATNGFSAGGGANPGGVVFSGGDITLTNSATNFFAILGATAGVSIDGPLLPNTDDGYALGSTTKEWSDLFLASGAVVNFANGNYTLTHSSGKITGSGDFSIGTSAVFTTGTIELGHASANTLSAASGVLSIEGQAVFAANTKNDVLQAGTFASDAGANDTYTCSFSPAITAYVTGTRYRFLANTANTGAATININSIGAKTIKKAAGGITTDLADNDIRAGQWIELVYDGTNMQMVSLLGNAPAGSGTVTSVGWVGGIVSIATPTSTPAFTIAGTSGGVPYFNSSTTWATSAALAANAVLIGGGAGAAPASTTTGTGVITAIGNNVNATGGLLTTDGTATEQNKTQATTWAGGNNTHTRRLYLLLKFEKVALTSMIPNTNDFSTAGYGRVRFTGNSTATNSNYAVYRSIVPIKFVGGSGQDLTMEKMSFRTSGTQTGAVTFHVGMRAVADSAAIDATDATSFSNYVVCTSAALSSPAAGDRFSIANKTLTTWRTSLTAGDDVEVGVTRNDTNTDTMDLTDMLISYVETQ